MVIAAVTTTKSLLSPCRPLFTPLLFSLHFLKTPNLRPSSSSHLHIRFLAPPSPPPMASSFTAEYAKSNRSTCKTCSDTIAKSALRLGVVIKDKQRGFDATKWHHFHCFSFNSNPVPSAMAIRGFDSLKSDDQEAMKRLVEEHGKVKEVDEDATAGDKQKSTKKRKLKDIDEDATPGDKQKSTEKMENRGSDNVIDVGEKQGSPKKLLLSASEKTMIKIALAASDIQDIYQGATLLPKWKAFHTIIFLEKDDGLQDSSKIAAFDFDGCLANTDVKRTGADAWSLMYKSIPDKLQKLYNDGYKLVGFSLVPLLQSHLY